MWQAIRNHPRAVLGAVLAHIVFLAILVISFRFSAAPDGNFGEPPEVIEAVAVDEKVIQAELDKRKATEQRKKNEAREARLREQRRKEDLKKQKAAAANKLKQEKAAEKKRLAELDKKKQQKAAEKKRKEEEARQARLEQERKVIEKQEALQAEIARQEAEFQKQQEADQQARQTEARRQANQSEISKYENLIKQEIERHWSIPATAHDDMNCEVKVRLIPGGDVVDVKIIKSSGDAAFDRSVEQAVYRAAPLSVPPVESGLFNEFREVVFQFEPRNRVK